MAGRTKSVALGDDVGGVVDRVFEVGKGNVDHGAAPLAHEVMVVTGKRLGELVPDDVIVRCDPVDDAGLLEHGEVPVRRAQCELRVMLEDFRDGDRMRRLSDCFGEPDARRRCSLRLHGEPLPGDRSDIHGASVRRVTECRIRGGM